jgi:integrase/recombinase XerD
VIDYLGETRERDRVLVHLLSHGLRAGEIVALNVAAFDGKLCLLLTPRIMSRDSCAQEREPSSIATVPYLAGRRRGNFIRRSPFDSLHHVVRQGQRLSYHGIYFAVEKIGN